VWQEVYDRSPGRDEMKHGEMKKGEMARGEMVYDGEMRGDITRDVVWRERRGDVGEM
jgi:hypothetical protein